MFLWSVVTLPTLQLTHGNKMFETSFLIEEPACLWLLYHFNQNNFLKIKKKENQPHLSKVEQILYLDNQGVGYGSTNGLVKIHCTHNCCHLGSRNKWLFGYSVPFQYWIRASRGKRQCLYVQRPYYSKGNCSKDYLPFS